MCRVDPPMAAPTGEVLQDLRLNGSERPWRRRKMQALRVADAYDDLGFDRVADSMRECGSHLTFAECPQGHEMKLRTANFCRRRLCPMCMWRRSLKTAHQVRLIAHEALAREPGLRFLMFTGTIRNVPGEELADTVSLLGRSFQRMVSGKRFGGRQYRGWLAGWFRALETTYNPDRDNFHPHVHALLAVRSSYWKEGYMRLDEWREQWQAVLGVDYRPLVEVHPVRQRRRRDGTLSQGIDGAVAEVAKYAVDPDFLGDEEAEELEAKGKTTSEVVLALHKGLAGKRLTAFGGLLRVVYADLQSEGAVDDVESDDADLVRVDDAPTGCQCSVCQSDLIDHLYRWHGGLRVYVG